MRGAIAVTFSLGHVGWTAKNHDECQDSFLYRRRLLFSDHLQEPAVPLPLEVVPHTLPLHDAGVVAVAVRARQDALGNEVGAVVGREDIRDEGEDCGLTDDDALTEATDGAAHAGAEADERDGACLTGQRRSPPRGLRAHRQRRYR